MTLTKDDLQAISQLLDEKLEEKLETKLEEKLEEKLEKKLDEKLDAKLEEKLEAKLEEKLEAKLDEKFDSKFDARLDAKFDERLTPIENRLKRIEVDLLENNIIPRLNTIEACYLDTSARYIEYTDRMETAFQDIEVLKQVVAEHSEKLQKIS